MPIKIYSLTNPINNKVFYVGITYRELNYRLKEHLKSPNKSIRKIVDRLKIKGLVPSIELLEECAYKKADIRERDWIIYMKEQGYRLCNKVLLPKPTQIDAQ
jgi:predicted GIY-YIG superfamily endonuclease